jgi:hypothetical protein
LEGTVTDAQYSALFAAGGAQDPTTGARLVQTSRPGMELVVSAHKSLAELGVIGYEGIMHGILDAERDVTMNYLDGIVRERGGRRGRQRTQTQTGGLIYAHTRHATSRAGDPCPHDHVLVANLVEMDDLLGGWKAADTTLWRDELHAATMVGRLAAARKAVEARLAIEADAGPSGMLRHWRVAGFPEAVVEVHSWSASQAPETASTPWRPRWLPSWRSQPSWPRERPTDDPAASGTRRSPRRWRGLSSAWAAR